MSLPIIFMYSGQGAQHYQMGKDLYDNEAVFRQAMDSCDAIVSPLLGESLCKIIYGDKRKSDPFVRTHTPTPPMWQWVIALPNFWNPRAFGPIICLATAWVSTPRP